MFFRIGNVLASHVLQQYSFLVGIGSRTEEDVISERRATDANHTIATMRVEWLSTSIEGCGSYLLDVDVVAKKKSLSQSEEGTSSAGNNDARNCREPSNSPPLAFQLPLDHNIIEQRIVSRRYSLRSQLSISRSLQCDHNSPPMPKHCGTDSRRTRAASRDCLYLSYIEVSQMRPDQHLHV